MLKSFLKRYRWWFVALYGLLLIVAFIRIRAFWTPDIIFIAGFGLFLLLGKGKRFATHFLPFVVLLLSYEKLRSLAPLLNSHVNYMPMIHFDRWLFGVLPTEWLQARMWHGHLQWYDFVFYFFYMLHFVVPLALGILIWLKKPKHYWTFVCGLVVLSYSGFITYILYPASPPWLSSELGYLQPPIAHISSDIWRAFGVQDVSGFYKQLSPNLVAAVPSLHSAYPLLFALFVRKIWGNRWFCLAMVYPSIIWFAVVYLGEHYVIDVILGILYAYASYRAAPYVLTLARKCGVWLRRKWRTSRRLTSK